MFSKRQARKCAAQYKTLSAPDKIIFALWVHQWSIDIQTCSGSVRISDSPLRRVRAFAPQRIDLRPWCVACGEWSKAAIPSLKEFPP